MDEPSEQPVSPDVSGDLSETTIGDFRLLRRIGAGGMAEVYLAEQTSLKRSVAVKVLLEDTLTDKNDVMLKRFEQEARAAGGLSHPNIVQVYAIGHQERIHYIVQEYVQGQNLSQLIKRQGPPQFLEGLTWMIEVAEALKAASDAGIVHRDIKPENIMVTHSGVAKVTDFGLAQLNQQSERMNLTQAGTTMGTPWYMSPEQIRGEKLDHRADQYSFGITLYHLFSGQPPFPGRNSVAVAVQHLKEEPRHLSDVRRDLPRALCDTIHRMMAKSPDERFQSPDELIAAFKDLSNAPLNSDILEKGSWISSLIPWIPRGRAFPIAAVLFLALGLIAGNQLYAPVRLPDPQPQSLLPDAGDATKQFAVALLNPTNETAWRTVFERYPQTAEARMARFQLAMKYLTQTVPDYEKSTEELTVLYNSASTNPDDNLQLLALIRIAQAYIAQQQGDEETERRLTDVELNQDKFDDALLQDVLVNSPRLLRESAIAEQLRERFQEESLF